MPKNFYYYKNDSLLQLKNDLTNYVKSMNAEFECTDDGDVWGMSIKKPSNVPLSSIAIIIGIKIISEDRCEVVLAHGKWGTKVTALILSLFSPLAVIPSLILLPFAGVGVVKQGSLERDIKKLINSRLNKI